MVAQLQPERQVPARDAPAGRGALHTVPVHSGGECVLVVTGHADDATVVELRGRVADALAAEPSAVLLDVEGVGLRQLCELDVLLETELAGETAGVVMTTRGKVALVVLAPVGDLPFSTPRSSYARGDEGRVLVLDRSVSLDRPAS